MQCRYIENNGEQCQNETNMYRFVCDEHAEELEHEIYGRYCEFCGIDTFNEDKHLDFCEIE